MFLIFLPLQFYKRSWPAFWIREKRQSTAEVDFILQFENHLVPIEVKSGKSGTLRSLHQFIDLSDCKWAIRLYAGNISKETAISPGGKHCTMLNLPYFLAGMVHQYIEWSFKDRNG